MESVGQAEEGEPTTYNLIPNGFHERDDIFRFTFDGSSEVYLHSSPHELTWRISSAFSPTLTTMLHKAPQLEVV